jgi:DNA invertase Pin-like site-specific DNA recombinase
MTEQIDTSSAAGRLVPHVFGALAEFERFTQQQ